jgi:epoxyqueuosine reductase
LAELFALDDEVFRERFRRSPLWRPRRRGLLRNAAIALGNRPDEAGLRGLLRGLRDKEGLVRGACAWALGQYKSSAAGEALSKSLAVEPDAEVRREIEAALQPHDVTRRRANGS